MTILSPIEGAALFAFFAVAMVGLVLSRTRQERSADGFLVANRDVSAWRGAFSIAVSWMWAPAIFICSLQAYTKGLPGAFWFVFPNVVCFFLFAAVAVRLRTLLPDGYSFPEYIWYRFNRNKAVHLAFLAIAVLYQLGAIVMNALAGGVLLNLVSGISVHAAIVGMSAIALAYSLFSGLKASVFTDVVQMSLILLICLLLVPWSIFEAGGMPAITNGLSGIGGEYGNLFNLEVAWLMGIPMTVTLLSSPLGDQMFYQRAMAVRRERIVAMFVRGGLLFGLVPITISLLGFLGVTLAREQGMAVPDPQMIGPLVIAELLPKWALYLFCFMALAGLCSTLDSAFCAISSLGSVDIYRRYINREPSDRQILLVSRLFMLALAIIGTLIAFFKPQLLWVSFILGAITAAGFFPVLFSLYARRVSGYGIFGAIVVTLLFVTPLNIYANVSGSENLVVIAALLSIGIGLSVCIASLMIRSPRPYAFAEIKSHANVIAETGEA